MVGPYKGIINESHRGAPERRTETLE